MAKRNEPKPEKPANPVPQRPGRNPLPPAPGRDPSPAPHPRPR
jgi:hypothetical protein